MRETTETRLRVLERAVRHMMGTYTFTEERKALLDAIPDHDAPVESAAGQWFAMNREGWMRCENQRHAEAEAAHLCQLAPERGPTLPIFAESENAARAKYAAGVPFFELAALRALCAEAAEFLMHKTTWVDRQPRSEGSQLYRRLTAAAAGEVPRG